MDPSILLLLISVGLLVLVLTSRRRQQREQQALQARLVPGAEVMTASGLHATVASLDDTVAVLQTGPGQQSRWDRRAIARLLSVPDEVWADGDETGDDEIGDDEISDDEIGDDETATGGPGPGRRAEGPIPHELPASPDQGDDPDRGNVTVSGDDIGPKETGQSKRG